MADFPLRQDKESAKAYEAFTTYCGLGTCRSLAKVGQALGKSTTLIERWSITHHWQDRIRPYDETLARVQANEVAERYKQAVRDHFDRYHDVGLKLYFTAKALLDRLYENVDTMPITPALLTSIARTLTISADVEAHALQLGQLIPALQKLQSDSLDDVDFRTLTDDQLRYIAQTGRMPAPTIQQANYTIRVIHDDDQMPTITPKKIDYRNGLDAVRPNQKLYIATNDFDPNDA